MKVDVLIDHNNMDEENKNELTLLINSRDGDNYSEFQEIHSPKHHDIESVSSGHGSLSKYRTEYWRTRLNTGFFAVVFLEFIFFFGYFSYTLYYVEQLYHSFSISKVVILVCFQVFFVITQTCLFKTTFTDPGGIPNGFPDDEIYGNVIFSELDSQWKKRRCLKCSAYKPDRAHHCSKCKRCILKMDHHCPFVNNCVGYFNYKFFVLFLGWTTFLCFYISFTTLDNFKELVDIHENTSNPSKPSIILGVLFIISLVFGIGIGAFGSTHFKYIIYNQTTIEYSEKTGPRKRGRFSDHPPPQRAVYNISYTENLKQVFGKNPWTWFLPIQNPITPISGLCFPSITENSRLI